MLKIDKCSKMIARILVILPTVASLEYRMQLHGQYLRICWWVICSVTVSRAFKQLYCSIPTLLVTRVD